MALEAADHITSTHRGHGHCVAKGTEFRRMCAMDVPVPFSPALEDLTVPTPAGVADRARLRGELVDAP